MVSGLPNARLDEVLRFGSGQLGFAQTLDAEQIGCVLLDEVGALEAGEIVRGTGEVVRTAVGSGVARPRGRSAGPAAGRRRADRRRTPRAGGAAGAGDPRPRAGHRAGADRHPGDRFAVSARPRPARADHRRPRHRQDRDRRRYRDQPEIQRHDLRLCRGGAEILHRGAGDRRGAPAGCAGALHLRRRRRRLGAGAAMDRAVRRHDDGGVFPRSRPARAGGARRPDQARRDAPRNRAADAASAGARGLSRRHLLPARAAAGARGEAVAGAAAAAR